MSVRYLVVACIVLSMLWVGCIEVTPTGDDPPAGVHTVKSFAHPLSKPLIINSTAPGATVDLKIVMRAECRFTPIPKIQTKIFDRDGLVQAIHLPVGGESKTFEFALTPNGTSPWLFVAQPYPCHDGWASHVNFTGEGYRADISHGFRNVVMEERDQVVMTVEPGESTATAAWNGGAFAWMTIFGVPTVTRDLTRFQGTIEAYYPDGTLWRKDTYSVTAGHDATFGPIQYFEGDYELYVRSDSPVAERTVVTYNFDVLRFHPFVCELGFEWQELCP